MVSSKAEPSASSGAVKRSALPDGKFRLVGWDVDATGQLVTDEICQLGAYAGAAGEDFSQYIMPYKDLTLFAQRRYMMFTKTIGRFRALKDKTNNKMLRTKSEISALVDFLMWLEKIKNQEPGCTGLILLCHDAAELPPLLLIQALNRYDLLDRFSSIVKGFSNCYAFVKLKCESSVTSFTLKTLSKILLDKEDEQTHSARNRARIAYQLVQHLRAGLVDKTGSGDTSLIGDLGELAQFTATVGDMQAEVAPRLEQLQRQQRLSPLFKSSATAAATTEQTTAEQQKRSSPRRPSMQERRRAVQLRSQLLEASIDYDTLSRTWSEGQKEKLVGLLEATLSEWSEADRREVCEIAVRHFECPPPARGGRRPRSRRPSSQKSATSEGGGNSTPQTPTSSSPSSANTPPPPPDTSAAAAAASKVVQPPPANVNSTTVE